MESKINQLMKQWPKGTVGTAPWMQRCGAYRQLVRQYVAGEWLQPFERGAFVRADDNPDWRGGLYALQTQLHLDVHAAAATALSLKGLGHYLPLGGRPAVYLFGAPGTRLPAWFARHSWEAEIRYSSPALFVPSVPESFTRVEHGEFSIQVSAPERAMLEVCHLATTNEAIEHLPELMAGLNTLRPQVVQSLLEACRSVRAKRLFLWSAEEAAHEWFSRLSPVKLDLGKGKRQLYRGGRWDPKYQITVPGKEKAHV